MREFFLILVLLFTLLCGHAIAEPKPNIQFIAIDDLRCDVGAFGVSHANTPQLDAFAKTARVFTQHYVQAPTCGASPFALLRGRYADGTEELYDIVNDPNEWHNLADKPEHAAIIAEHKKWLPKVDRPLASGSANRVLTYDQTTDEAVWEGKTVKRTDPIPQ